MWWKIHIPVTSSEDLEEAGSELVEITGHGIDIQEGEVIAYTDQQVSLSTLVSNITDWRKDWFGEVQNHSPLQIEPLKDENWSENWKKYFTAVIFRSDFGKFPKQPELYYNGKNVQVTGKVKEYKGKPEIILKDPAQIRIINP